MAQRLGRVNRFGDCDDTRVDVVHPESFGKTDNKTGEMKASELDTHRSNTLGLLKRLPVIHDNAHDASPKAIGELMSSLSDKERDDAFAPEPKRLEATDILFDVWALTTIKNKMPGRPPVAPYLHGVDEWEPPRTNVAWREEVDRITGELIAREGDDLPQVLLANYPLKPHELLSDTSERVLTGLQQLAADHSEARAWLVDKQGDVNVFKLRQIANPAATKKPDKERLEEMIADGIVLLPPTIGGLTRQGTLNGRAVPDTEHPHGYDIADCWLDEDGEPRRERLLSHELEPTDGPRGMALIRTIDLKPLAEEFAPPDGETETDASLTCGCFWHWYVRPLHAEDATRASTKPITWDHHTRDVVERTAKIVGALNLPDDLKQAVILAAKLHDLGKKRELWQRSIGNPHPTDWYAKPGKSADGPRWRPRFISPYRHEFGSLLDVLDPNQEHAVKLGRLSPEMQDIVLHLIAVHHGYARPHFPQEAYDHERFTAEQNELTAHEVMRRFARLQRRYGRWGLAYLESLLRAADWAASANPTNDGGAS